MECAHSFPDTLLAAAAEALLPELQLAAPAGALADSRAAWQVCAPEAFIAPHMNAAPVVIAFRSGMTTYRYNDLWGGFGANGHDRMLPL